MLFLIGNSRCIMPGRYPTGCLLYTSTVKERPYIRFVRENNEAIVQTFGRNNPAFASSLQGKQSAGFAADGNVNTFWEAADEDHSPWWMMDTEKGLLLRSISVRFPKADIYRYIIEASDDNKEWKTLLDKRKTMIVEQGTDKTFSAQEPSVTCLLYTSWHLFGSSFYCRPVPSFIE